MQDHIFKSSLKKLCFYSLKSRTLKLFLGDRRGGKGLRRLNNAWFLKQVFLKAKKKNEKINK